ncbi:hypothetical protein [Streptomyces noursei]|uniref:hypothetical protein n=1 Tax=Streptomyces noursei TaxID=1971 RepID=UPI0016756CD2|nr:hypothetical protein [Streptomyces noursei]MCZ1019762.1 hypothetical protein [Streptomyces noursei]GGX36786.1 hypothetical protein GCM10010341_68100 [Streptomyces noursei]
MTYRYLTQHALTGEWLSPHLPLTDVEFGPELNGPGHLRGTLAPRLAWLHPELADPGNTLLYVERDGLLRWGGLIWQVEPEGGELKVEAAGWSSYLKRRHDLDGELDGRGPYVNTDPCTIARDIVAYAQSIPDGDLGLTVDATTSTTTVGTAAEPWHSRWWETPVLGDQFDDLVKGPDSPDYTCSTWWGHHRQPVRRIQLGYPRLGARRTDVTFTSGINIIDSPPVTYSADDYAQVIIATGSGEGRAQQRAIDAVRNRRLRLEHVLDLPEVRSQDTLARRAKAERAWRQSLGHVEEITVRDHPHAPIGSWQVGDDVRVTVRSEWANWSGWCRITGWTIRPDTPAGETATLTLARADAYHYGTAA